MGKKDYSNYDNREFSWLKFNKRVLEEATDPVNPLAERLSFLAIYQSNLDEFTRVRCGALDADRKVKSKDKLSGLTAEEQLEKIFKREKALNSYKDEVYRIAMREMEQYGVHELRYGELTPAEKRGLRKYFESEVKPILTPMLITKKQPLPFLKNSEIYAVLELEAKGTDSMLGIIPCSLSMLKRLVPVSKDKKRFILLEEVILHYSNELYPYYMVKGKNLIRVIRSAEIDMDAAFDDEELDYPTAVESALKTRNHLCAIKMEYSHTMTGFIKKKLTGALKLEGMQLLQQLSPLNLAFMYQVRDLLAEEKKLYYDKRIPQNPASISKRKSMISQIKESDKLLFYPYDNVGNFMRLLTEAADDPKVTSIKMTLYRMASDSKIAEALMEAAENGKEVTVLVELRARFDEERNIKWAAQLEEAGCKVIYGLKSLKVHSKLCLITMKKNKGYEYITQVGTGNYNEKTAKIYTDYCLMTADQEIGKDADRVFNALAAGETVTESKELLVAPNCMMDRIVEMIEAEKAKAEKGQEGYIGVKINSLTDKSLIEKLIEAGKAGVKIQLIVRGSCCISAGIPGETDNIEVISIVGRFLEHSRVYIFGKGAYAKVYISSADFMTRNMLKRVEVAAPIKDRELKARVIHDFGVLFSDDVKARRQHRSEYDHRETQTGVNAQEALFAEAYERAKTPRKKTAEGAKKNDVVPADTEVKPKRKYTRRKTTEAAK